MKRLSPSSLTLSLALQCPSMSLSLHPSPHLLFLTSFYQFLSVTHFLSLSLFSFSLLLNPTFFSVQHLFSIYVICSSFIGSSLMHLCLLFPAYLCPALPLLFPHLLRLCHLRSIHYQFTQSTDHISQAADTYHTYQIDLFVHLFTCFVTNKLHCVCI